MSALVKVRHRLEEDTVVLSTIRGRKTISRAMLSEPEAKRLAWALLADLDPDEADEIIEHQERRRKDALRMRLLSLFYVAPCTSTEAATVVGATVYQVSGMLLPLKKAGLVRRLDDGGDRDPAIFGLTDEGRAVAAGYLLSDRTGRQAEERRISHV
jgi:hypothetical protein